MRALLHSVSERAPPQEPTVTHMCAEIPAVRGDRHHGAQDWPDVPPQQALGILGRSECQGL
eukprot:2468331-Alexandrium_andersonii.AAC.2